MLATDKRVEEAKEEMEILDRRIGEAKLAEAVARGQEDYSRARELATQRAELQERHSAVRLVICRGGLG